MPGIYEHLAKWPDSFPLEEKAPVYPFGGFVLNFNTSTRLHRDKNDDQICTVIPISDCEGGELCLMEPGLVISLPCGVMAVFRSADVSHFNLSYKGQRGSLVCHSDKHCKGWIEDANGWVESRYYQGDQGADEDSDEVSDEEEYGDDG
jgi:hypothetical protein